MQTSRADAEQWHGEAKEGLSNGQRFGGPGQEIGRGASSDLPSADGEREAKNASHVVQAAEDSRKGPGTAFAPAAARAPKLTMAIVDTHPERISGPWVEGFVLDKHVISSVPIGYRGDHMQFDTLRSPLGELVYRFKNKGGPADEIVHTATDFAARRWPSMIDRVMSVPPSVARVRQPGAILAEGIAAGLNVSVLENVVVKVKTTPQMKNVLVHERKALLGQSIEAGTASVAGMSVLIVDDLWETGSTMRRVAEVVIAMGAKDVRALVMTRTK